MYTSNSSTFFSTSLFTSAPYCCRFCSGFGINSFLIMLEWEGTITHAQECLIKLCQVPFLVFSSFLVFSFFLVFNSFFSGLLGIRTIRVFTVMSVQPHAMTTLKRITLEYSSIEHHSDIVYCPKQSQYQ